MVALVVKQIKPKKLKDKVFREFTEKAMAGIGKGMKSDFEKTTATWNTDVTFEVIESAGKDKIEVLAGTDNEIYGFVDKGTKAHRIVPKRAPALRFQGTYKAKTTPGVLSSKSGGSSGDVIYSQGVNHPGTKARNFSQAIEKKWQPKLKREIEKALREARKKSGHEIN